MGEWALYSGSKFHGRQTSERDSYPVQVELKHVDLDHSYLCGYLKIQGLTKEHPTLTTFFEGEIIGKKHSFLTKKWEADASVDEVHWGRFKEFLPYVSKLKKEDFVPDFSKEDHIFMRWKEVFLVPDHSVTSLSGASYAGFYYICYRKQEAKFYGYYYYHKISEFQSLELQHTPERNFATFEFR